MFFFSVIFLHMCICPYTNYNDIVTVKSTFTRELMLQSMIPLKTEEKVYLMFQNHLQKQTNKQKNSWVLCDFLRAMLILLSTFLSLGAIFFIVLIFFLCQLKKSKWVHRIRVSETNFFSILDLQGLHFRIIPCTIIQCNTIIMIMVNQYSSPMMNP